MADVRDLGEGTEQTPAVPEIVWTTRLQPALLRTSAYDTISRAASALLGVPRVRLHFDHAIFKPPHVGGPTAWHQDVYFDPAHDSIVATMWIALVDADEHNGCMRFVPGSHTGPVYPHRPFGRDGREAYGFSRDGEVVCPVPAGGMTVHMQRTLHSTGPNLSDRTRAAWILKMAPEIRSPARLIASASRDSVRRRSRT